MKVHYTNQSYIGLVNTELKKTNNFSAMLAQNKLQLYVTNCSARISLDVPTCLFYHEDCQQQLS